MTEEFRSAAHASELVKSQKTRHICRKSVSTVDLVKVGQMPEDTVASFFNVFSGQKFATVDYTHYLNKRGWRLSDKEAESILKDRSDIVIQIEPGVLARVQ